MKKTLTHKAGDALLELEQIVIHASIYWEFHWTLISRESFTSHKAVFEENLYWYQTSKESSLISAIASISKFFETNPESINIHYLMKLLKVQTEDWSMEIAEMKRFLEISAVASKDITILRSNYYVHKNKNLSFKDTYQKTSSKYDHIRELIENMRSCLSVVSLAASGQAINTKAHSEKTVQELELILNKLRK